LKIFDNTLNIADIERCSRICGPGLRFVIWVQGCGLGCKGCWNTEMWSFDERSPYTVDEILGMVQKEDVEGVTILGGEPLYQSKVLLKLVKKLKESGYNIMLYTGFEQEEITDLDSKELFSLSDIVICGRYEEDKRSIYLRWRGSLNQQIIINNKEFENLIDMFNEQVNEVEIHFDDYGNVKILGYPDTIIKNEVLYETGF